MPSLTTDRMTVDRRVALKLLASAVAATMARCSPPDEEIIPYADMPEGLVAGEPMRFATTLSLSGMGAVFSEFRLMAGRSRSKVIRGTRLALARQTSLPRAKCCHCTTPA